jgi:L-iditol 2-dehydrogenase
MKAAVYYAPNDLRIEERPTPSITSAEMLIKVAYCANCGSDVRTWRFGARNITHPITMGHELTGTIVEIGSAVAGFSPGQHVAVAPAVPCGECPYCRRGVQTMCDNLRSIGNEYHGGFAEFMVVPPPAIRTGCVYNVPDRLPLEEAALAEPLAGAINGQELLNVGMEDTVVVLGAGPLRCMHADLAKVRGAGKVMVADIQPRRLEMARPFAADILIDITAEDLQGRVLEETGGAGASVVIVAAPSGKEQEQALTLAAKQGRVSFFGGLPKSDPCINLDANIVHYRELFLMGAYGSKPRHNRMALDLLAAGRIHVSALISALVPLDRIIEALEMVSRGEALKVIVKPESDGA